MEEGVLPEMKRVISAVNSDSAMLSLINRVLDSAEAKGIRDLLAIPPEDQQPGDAFVSPHLERVLTPLIWRRNRNLSTASKQKMAQASTPSSELHSDQAEALRQITALRKREMGNPDSLK